MIFNLDDFKKLPEYKDFIKKNPIKKIFKITTRKTKDTKKITKSIITITKKVNNYKVVFYKGITDKNGVIDNIELPILTDNTTYKINISKY